MQLLLGDLRHSEAALLAELNEWRCSATLRAQSHDHSRRLRLCARTNGKRERERERERGGGVHG